MGDFTYNEGSGEWEYTGDAGYTDNPSDWTFTASDANPNALAWDDATQSWYWPEVGTDPTYSNAGGTPVTAADAPSILQKLVGTFGSSAVNAFKNYIFNPDTGTINLAGLGTAAAALYGATGGNKVQTGGYSTPVPKSTAVREAVPYTYDPNRTPGSMGRQYFTDLTYVPSGGDVPAARAAAHAQAQGLASLQQPTHSQAAVPATPVTWNTPTMQSQRAAQPQNASSAYPQIPEPQVAMAGGGQVPQFKGHLESGGFVMSGQAVRGAGGGDRERGLQALHRGLGAKAIRGPGTERSDSIPTSIDGKHPAAVANGEAYVPKDRVTAIGGGSPERGADRLMKMMDRLRTQAPKHPDHVAPNDGVRRFADGAAVPATPTSQVGYGTSAANTLSPWVGPYVGNALSQGAAAAEMPYQAYTGPLTAGASPLQQQAFSGISGLAQAGYTPEQYRTQSFGAPQATQYMNPYLSAALQPTLQEMQRQNQITRLGDAARLTKAGAFGGSRQAIMESESNRNLLDAQRKAIAEGYSTAYDKAAGQFNTEQSKALEAQKLGEASRQYGAEFGLKSLDQLAQQGAAQRGITGEGIAADKAQFEEARDWAYKMPQYQLGLLSGLPLGATTTTPNTTGLSSLQTDLGNLLSLYKTLSGVTPTTTTTTKTA